MRKFLIPLLLASALAPAAAFAQDSGGRARAERDHRDYSDNRSSDSRPQRAERVQRSERADRPARVERSQRVERPARVQRIERSYDDRRNERRVERRIERPPVQVEPVREVRSTETVRRINRTERNGNLADGFRSAVREHRDYGDGDRRVRERRDYERDRDGWRDRDGRRWRWSGDWRRVNSYNWYSYRNRYGSLYRLGRYYDPYGYGYRRFSIGFTLWPSYYGSSFWLKDPWQYRLPPAYGPYRWVRYYDDALLVNIYSGEVVDVIHNFFW